LDAAGAPVRGLRADDISITENGIPRTVTALTCPQQQEPQPLSIGFMVDSHKFTDVCAAGVRRFLDYTQMPPSEAGITTMDKGVYIVQDFTRKKDRMVDATSRLISSPGIHLQRIFYEANTGGVPFIS